MKKSHRHDELSDERCESCGKRLKKRLENNQFCYRCYAREETARGHPMQDGAAPSDRQPRLKYRV